MKLNIFKEYQAAPKIVIMKTTSAAILHIKRVFHK